MKVSICCHKFLVGNIPQFYDYIGVSRCCHIYTSEGLNNFRAPSEMFRAYFSMYSMFMLLRSCAHLTVELVHKLEY